MKTETKAIRSAALAFFALLVALAVDARALTLDMVTVGNPGNAPDTRYNSISVGSVDHVYQIAKYEITAGQYTEFLNAVAKADPNGLYSDDMGDASNATFGANIQRSGASPNFGYSVATDWANRPVNFVNIWDAARFANWLNNGQPTGAQGPTTTEGGAYINVGNQATFARQPGAKFFIPTESEWYKAAYHNKSAGLAASYFDYPTGSNTAPINTLPDPGNHANFYDGTGNGDFTIGDPYYRTEVGAFVNSPSPYGTFDQGGNVYEWNETAVTSSSRGVRGGSWDGDSLGLLASGSVVLLDPTLESLDLGFRVASMVPELTGDYNGNGVVDAADYTVWRDTLGSTTDLRANGDNTGASAGKIDQADYATWKTNFGNHAGSGLGATAVVPEPATLWMLIAGILIWCCRRRPRVS